MAPKRDDSFLRYLTRGAVVSQAGWRPISTAMGIKSSSSLSDWRRESGSPPIGRRREQFGGATSRIYIDEMTMESR